MKFINLASCNSQFRGLDCYKAKKVIGYEKINDSEYRSKVKGSNGETYDVFINITRPRSSSCNCAFASGRRVVCKHMIASYFKIFPNKVKEFNDDVDRINREYEESLIEERELKIKEITKYVNSLSAKEARHKLIEKLIEEYDDEMDRNNKYWQ